MRDAPAKSVQTPTPDTRAAGRDDDKGNSPGHPQSVAALPGRNPVLERRPAIGGRISDRVGNAPFHFLLKSRDVCDASIGHHLSAVIQRHRPDRRPSAASCEGRLEACLGHREAQQEKQPRDPDRHGGLLWPRDFGGEQDSADLPDVRRNGAGRGLRHAPRLRMRPRARSRRALGALRLRRA